MMEIENDKHEFNIIRSSNLSVSVESVYHVATPTKSSGEAKSCKGICNQDFELTHEMLQDDEFMQDVELQNKEPTHEVNKMTRESSTPHKVISSELLSIQSTNVVPQQRSQKEMF